MDYKTIQIEVKEGVAAIVLNRADAFNAMDMTMAKELMDAAVRCDEDPGIRAVLLTGKGKAFSGGGDLRYFAQQGENLPSAMKEMTVYIHSAISRFLRMDAPLITAVNGVAAGIGMSLAISGDLVISAESSSFNTAYPGVGLSADGGMTYLLPRFIGLKRTKDLLLNNRRITAREALEWGLVNRVVPDGQLMAESEGLARTLAQGPTRAFGKIKKLLSDSFSTTLETQMELEARAIAEMAKTKDAQGAIRAFLEKRRPTFVGQ